VSTLKYPRTNSERNFNAGKIRKLAKAYSSKNLYIRTKKSRPSNKKYSKAISIRKGQNNLQKSK
jgi:hypothetical protein